MFGQFFGDYLIKKGTITTDQFEIIQKEQKSSRVKLGFIAVSEKILTLKQTEEINRLQTQMDKKFGDIAMELGYLDQVQLDYLLEMQGNPYLSFIQSAIESNILSVRQIEDSLESFKEENDFTDQDIEALKAGNIDHVLTLYVNVPKPLYNEYISLAVRNVIRFIHNDIRIEASYPVTSYYFETLSAQSLKGDHQIFIGLAASGNHLLRIASPYAKENFISVDEDAYDAVCEFLNCVNGLFASKLSKEQINIDMLPPVFDSHKTIESKEHFYVTPLFFDGERVDLITAIDVPIDFH